MVLEKVKEIIASQLSMEMGEIKEESVLTDDLGVDSLEIFEIVMSLEEEFNIEIPNEDIEGIKCVGDIAKYISGKVNN